MKFVLFSFALIVPALLATLPFSGQTFKPKTISFSGYSNASSAELLAATGLSANAELTQAQMQAAAQALNDTGFFSDIRFRFDGQDLHYDLKPSTGFLPVHFENFPWWDDHQLLVQLEAQVPLFHGTLPPESGMQQKVAAALTSLLTAKQVQATVAAEPRIDRITGKMDAVNFRITNPAIQIGDVSFTGASPEWSDTLNAIEKAAAGQDFSPDATSATLTQAIEHIYKNKGYLDIAVTRVSSGEPQVSAEKVTIPVTVALTEGKPFRLGSFSLSGSVLVSNAEFLKTAQLKPGDIVEEDKLRLTMQMLSGPYVTRGYLHAKINATPAFNRQQQTVDYAITVVPGDVCHIGKLEVQNLDEERKTLFLKTWKLNEGDPFDASYAPGFLKKNASALHSLDGYSASYRQIEHLDTHVIDLVVTFRKGGPLS